MVHIRSGLGSGNLTCELCGLFGINRLQSIAVFLLVATCLILMVNQTGQENTHSSSKRTLILDVNYTDKPVVGPFVPLTTRKQIKNLVEDILKDRRERVEKVCARIGSVSNKTTEVSGVKAANFSYCVVQKAGCTMWIRLFKFLEGQKIETGNPMTLTKALIHTKDLHFYKRFKPTGSDAGFISRSVRAMTVRNPYTRLWSAYIDKFLLPDFWGSKGKHIVSLIRKNPKQLSTACGHDVTFPEFIQYVITIGHKFTYWNQDKHWLPASDICDPCAFKPHIIGKQESFMNDFKYTLKNVKLDYLLPEITSVDPTEFEIKDEIDYNFKVLQHFKDSKCTDVYELCKRIWTAFILNGYLPSEETFPTNIDTNSLNIESFYKLVNDVRTKYNITKAETKEKRKHALATAYKLIPEKNMKKLKDLYKMDFKLFDYASEPEFLHE